MAASGRKPRESLVTGFRRAKYTNNGDNNNDLLYVTIIYYRDIIGQTRVGDRKDTVRRNRWFVVHTRARTYFCFLVYHYFGNNVLHTRTRTPCEFRVVCVLLGSLEGHKTDVSARYFAISVMTYTVIRRRNRYGNGGKNTHRNYRSGVCTVDAIAGG